MTKDKFELFHQHKVQVYQHILYLLGSREDARDITQSTAQRKIGESFMKVLVKCQFYLMMSFVALLLTVGTAISND